MASSITTFPTAPLVACGFLTAVAENGLRFRVHLPLLQGVCFLFIPSPAVHTVLALKSILQYWD